MWKNVKKPITVPLELNVEEREVELPKYHDEKDYILEVQLRLGKTTVSRLRLKEQILTEEMHQTIAEQLGENSATVPPPATIVESTLKEYGEVKWNFVDVLRTSELKEAIDYYITTYKVTKLEFKITLVEYYGHLTDGDEGLYIDYRGELTKDTQTMLKEGSSLLYAMYVAEDPDCPEEWMSPVTPIENIKINITVGFNADR